MSYKYFEDIVLNQKSSFGSYQVTEQEIIEFATKWDPQPFHIDKEEALKSVFEGLSASSTHIFAIVGKLISDRDVKNKSMAGLGTEIKFLKAVRPGDVLSIRQRVIEKRESASRPNAGIIKNHLELLNQNAGIVCEIYGVTLVEKRSSI